MRSSPVIAGRMWLHSSSQRSTARPRAERGGDGQRLGRLTRGDGGDRRRRCRRLEARREGPAVRGGNHDRPLRSGKAEPVQLRRHVRRVQQARAQRGETVELADARRHGETGHRQADLREPAPDRRRLGERQPHLRADASAGDGPEVHVLHQSCRLQLRGEAQTRRVARHAQRPRGIVDERSVVQDAQHPGLEVLERARPCLCMAVRHAHGNRVDGEVAAREILGHGRAELHVGQGTRPGVRLPPRSRDVDTGDRVGAEALMEGARLPQRARHGAGVPLDQQVQLARRATEQHVAHRPADDPDARQVTDGVRNEVECREAGLHGRTVV